MTNKRQKRRSGAGVQLDGSKIAKAVNSHLGRPPSFSTTLARARKAAAPIGIVGTAPLGPVNDVEVANNQADFDVIFSDIKRAPPALQPGEMMISMQDGKLVHIFPNGEPVTFLPSRQHDADIPGHTLDEPVSVADQLKSYTLTMPISNFQVVPTRYVVGFLMERTSERVLLLRKNKPAFQAGLLNGVGGKIEWDETPIQAMHREWREEIVPDWSNLAWRQFAVLKSSRTETYCFSAACHSLPRDSGFNDVGEELVTVHLAEIGKRRDALKQLRWLLPLAFEAPDEFMVTAELVAA